MRDGRRLVTVFARRPDPAAPPTETLTLRESEDVFRRAALQSADLVHECDRANGRITWFGDVDRILGCAPDEFPRTVDAWEKVIHPEDRGRVAANAARHFETGEPFFEEYRVQTLGRPDAALAPRGDPPSRRGRRAARSIGTVTDISGRRQIEEALRVSERRYRALFERNLAGVYRSTIEGRLLDCNESFARIFGYASREEVLRQAAWDFFVKPEDREAAAGQAPRAPEPDELRDLPEAQGRQPRLGAPEREPRRGLRRPPLRHRGHHDRHHGAQAGRGAGQAPRLPRPADEPAEPPPLQRPPDARRGAGPPAQPAAGRPLPRPRPLQGHQRLARPLGRRRAAAPGGRADPGVRPRGRHGGAPRRRRVHAARARASRPRRTPRRSRARSARRSTIRSGSTAASSSSRRASASRVYPSDGHDARDARPQRRLGDVPRQGAGPRQLPALHARP